MRRYYVISDSKTKKHVATLLRQDFKNDFFKDIVSKLKSKEYEIKVY